MLHLSASLQAILEDHAGELRTIPVPLPLPDAVALGPRWYRRERTSDSVIRFVEQTPTAADGELTAGRPERCSSCAERRDPLFVRTLPADVPAGAATPALCETCYGRMNQTSTR